MLVRTTLIKKHVYRSFSDGENEADVGPEYARGAAHDPELPVGVRRQHSSRGAAWCRHRRIQECARGT